MKRKRSLLPEAGSQLGTMAGSITLAFQHQVRVDGNRLLNGSLLAAGDCRVTAKSGSALNNASYTTLAQ